MGHADAVEPSDAPPASPEPRRSSAVPFLEDVRSHARRPRLERRRTRIVGDDRPRLERTRGHRGAGRSRDGRGPGVVRARQPAPTRSASCAGSARSRPRSGSCRTCPGRRSAASPSQNAGSCSRPGPRSSSRRGSTTPTSSPTRIGVADDEVVASLSEGDLVSLGDGGISLVVLGRRGDDVIARVRSGGRVMGRPGVTVPSGQDRAGDADRRRPRSHRRARGRGRGGDRRLVRAPARGPRRGPRGRSASPGRCSSPRSRPPRRSRTWTPSSRAPTRSWWPAATSASGCRSRTSPSTKKRSSAAVCASPAPSSPPPRCSSR